MQHKAWQQTFVVPPQGSIETMVTCPVCHSRFDVKVYSKSKARLRKLCFACCFFAIAGGGAIFGLFVGNGTSLMSYSLAVPFLFFALWQLLDALRGRFDPSDVVSHARGKVHRIFDARKITLPDS